MKIAIVTPPMPDHLNNSLPLLGPAVLKSFLESHGYEVDTIDIAIRIRFINRYPFRKIVNLNLFYQNDRVFNFLESGKDDLLRKEIEKIIRLGNLDQYDLVGFSIYDGSNLSFSLCIAKLLKEKVHQKIVFGGPVTYRSDYSGILDFDFVDFIVVGDGEEPLLNILRYLENGESLENCDGVFHKENGVLHTSKTSIFPIASKCLPTFNKEELLLYKSLSIRGFITLPYLLTRGCRFKCAFCNEYKNVRFEYTPLEKLISDIKFLLTTYGANSVYFTESNMNNDPEFIRTFSNRIISEGLRFYWGGLGTIYGLDENTIKLMARAGCKYIFFGVESASEGILNKMNIRKVFGLEKFKETFVLLQKYRIRTHNFYIVEFPFETYEEFRKNIEFLKQTARYTTTAECGAFQVVENSPIHLVPRAFNLIVREKDMRKFGLIKDRIIFHPFREFDEINGLKFEDKLKKGLIKTKLMDHMIFKHIDLRRTLRILIKNPAFVLEKRLSHPYFMLDEFFY